MESTTIYVDGAVGESIGSGSTAGAAAIARTTKGFFLGWLSRQLPSMTNNEAEYHGVLLGLELAQQLDLRSVEIVSDSQVIVWQMQGRSQVNSQRLKRLHRQTCHVAARVSRVRYRHVSREQNRVADALAAEAREGIEVGMKGARLVRPLRRILGL